MDTYSSISCAAMKIASDVVSLSLTDITYLLTHFSKEIGLREELIRSNARADIEEISLRAGITVSFSDDIAEAMTWIATLKPITKARIKYRGKNSEAVSQWSGRGLKPKWVNDLIAAGEDLEDYMTEEFKLAKAIKQKQ